ncbi:SMI1/KNR4 family protein [Actinoplanes sp. KI2]|uniref:SMI1/KNR4 family protein n=1 Tax=Actinoplanes sp. KI2 TaxID=2983315 RepID=UPI0021D6072D|nr:SMI1/KNR4 family protein [Actinoplanes sp. KI2]MCU7729379.1 SMI1/KNR4 family protein [Actinoplanes sp. KI2]
MRGGDGRVFGASGHGFLLEPALSADELDDLEGYLGVALPEEYRSFLTEVGAGGAGPTYGVFPVRREPAGIWRWHGDGADLTSVPLLAMPFPVQRIGSAALAELRQGCPDEADFDDLDTFDIAMQAYDERVVALLWDDASTAGAICLEHIGCAQRTWLVVSGPARGQMWDDPRVDEIDLRPLVGPGGVTPVTFAAWYLQWLDASERAMA